MKKTNHKNNSIQSKYSYFFLYLAVLICAVVLVFLVYHITSLQTNEMGNQQLKSMKNEVDFTLMHASYEINALAENAERITAETDGSRESLDSFITTQSELHSELSGGQCFRVCLTRPGCIIVPGEDISDDYDITQRDWYNQAIKAGVGNIYISAPYLDLFNNNICFTVAKVLSDGVTTVSLDYTMETIQQYLAELPTEKGVAILVNSEGMIVGANTDSLNGQMLETALPDMGRTWKKISHEEGGEGIVHQGMTTYFYTVAENNSYLIYSIDYFKLQGKNLLILSTILIFLLLVFVAMMVLFARNRKSRRIAEDALRSKDLFFDNIKGEFKLPLEQINSLTSNHSEVGGNIDETLNKIKESSIQLNHLFDNLLAFSAISHDETETMAGDSVKTDSVEADKEKALAHEKSINRLVLISKIILIVLIPAVIMFAVEIIIYQGQLVMNNCSETYYSELQEWVTGKKNTVDIMADMLESDSHILENYDDCVAYLRELSEEYDSISLIYIGDEYSSNPIIMSDGWTGNGNYVVQAYSWYANAKNAKEGYDVSAVHYDIDTREYVITFSRKLITAEGRFIGVLGIDFNVSDLIASLESAYTHEEYAFLVTKTGAILNHPYSEYQISYSDTVDVDDSVYKRSQTRDGLTYLRDYDRRLSVSTHREEEISGMRVYVVRSFFSVYGPILVATAVFVVLIMSSIILLFALWRRIDKWRKETNLKLADAVADAYEANQAKSKFLAQMSHEIRTPINAILGMNEMILRESKDAGIVEHAHDIKQSGNILLLLVNSILDFSKIENGKDDIILIQYNTGALVKELVSEISPLAEEHHLELVTEIDETLPTILYGDKVKLVQIIINLLTNAVKYTPKGSVTLEMRADGVEDGSLLLHVAVKDTGIGIKDEDKGKLFQSFRRLDLEKNHSIEGTGLGLYIVNHFLAKMDSTLYVDSVYGQGSEFSFTIRQDIIDASPIRVDAAEEKQVPYEEEKYLYAPKVRALVVDDNEINRRVAESLLKRSQMSVDLSDSGANCIEKLKNGKYDILLLDQMMPGLSGTETLEQIRREHLVPEQFPIIVMTANAIAGARDEYLAAGFQDYISKPIDPVELEKTLIRWLPEELVELRSQEEMEDAEAEDSSETVEVTAEEEPEAEEVSEGNTATYSNAFLQYLSTVLPEMDIRSGLASCGDSEEFLEHLLHMFSEIKLAEELTGFYEKGDFKDYCISIHGFKNNAYSLGLMAMGDLAYAMEEATRTEFADNILDMQAEILDQFYRVCSAINDYQG